MEQEPRDFRKTRNPRLADALQQTCPGWRRDDRFQKPMAKTAGIVCLASVLFHASRCPRTFLFSSSPDLHSKFTVLSGKEGVA